MADQPAAILKMIKNNKVKNKEIVVGMSGGVDSSMALVLLKRQGFKPIGVSLKYAVWQNEANLLRENVCCSAESFKIAENICQKLDVPYHIFDVAKEFKKQVIDYFIRELKDNKTPNPCIICNRYLKFKKLFEWAKGRGIGYVATGHYAKTRKNPQTQEYELLRPKDKEKDQTYSLCFLPQKWLKNIVFPLGNYTKQEVYRMAKREGFEFFLKRKQSQDLCFVSGKCLNCFLEKEIGKNPGLIKDGQGNILGKHRGLHFYTIGQRKGISLSGGPYFVKDFDTASNALIVSKNQEDLLGTTVFLSPVHFISDKPLKKELRVLAKIRYREPLAAAALSPLSEGKIKLVFDKPQRAITPGQFAVFYQKDVCLGGGKILPVPKT